MRSTFSVASLRESPSRPLRLVGYALRKAPFREKPPQGPASADRVDRGPDADLDEPSLDSAVRSGIGRRTGHRPGRTSAQPLEQRVVHDLLGLRPIADDPQARMEQPPGIPVVEAVYIGKKNLHVGNALSIIIRRTESAAAPRIKKKRIVRKDDPPKFPFRPDDYAPAIEGAVYTRAASSLSIM